MSESKGYRRKPVWIYIVAILFVLTPFIHLMGTLKEAGEPFWYSPEAWWLWSRHLDPAPAVISLMLCIAGLAILLVRSWSWWLGLCVLGTLCLYNIVLIRHSFAEDPFTQVLASVGSLLLLVLLYFSEFKKPFLNRRLRWWESEPRFRVRVPVNIQSAELTTAAKVQLMDISKSGVYLEPNVGEKTLSLPHDIVVEVNSELQLPCRFSRATEHGGSAYQITTITRHQARYLRRWIKLLSKEPDRLVR
ncbi:MAG: hypothetical protein ABIR96_06445 [Bdellovibrionota bacterium]